METQNTEKRIPLPRPGKDFNTAKRLYMEQFASALVTNNYLLVALAGVSLVAAGLIWLNLKTHQTFENFKPLVIRISDVGRAEALSYDSFRWEPQDAEIRYFLIQFVLSLQKRHYSRRRATIREAGCRAYTSVAPLPRPTASPTPPSTTCASRPTAPPLTSRGSTTRITTTSRSAARAMSLTSPSWSRSACRTR